MDDRFQHIFHADAALGADHQGIAGGNSQDVFDLFFDEIGLRGGQINFVDHRKNGEVVRSGKKGIGHGLRFHALAGIDHQQRAFTGGKCARNFVREIDVARRIDQVQAIGIAVLGLIVQANAFRLDGDAALALQVHGVEYLLVHLALREGAGHFEQAVRQGGLAVIDMRDNTEIPYELRVHSLPVRQD